MKDHNELLKEARELANILEESTLASYACGGAARAFRQLADVVEAYDKADSELAAACKTCDATMSTLICEHDDFRVITEGAWTNLRAARHLTRKAVDNWKEAQVDATLAVATRDHSELMERLADDPTTNQASEPVPEPAFVLDDDCPADPVEVAMRIECTQRINVAYRWQCHLACKWLGVPAYDGSMFDNSEVARVDGNAWLARLSVHIGVPLKAVWEETKGGG